MRAVTALRELVGVARLAILASFPKRTSDDRLPFVVRCDRANLDGGVVMLRPVHGRRGQADVVLDVEAHGCERGAHSSAFSVPGERHVRDARVGAEVLPKQLRPATLVAWAGGIWKGE